jgi:AraC-like DNA-binding protein
MKIYIKNMVCPRCIVAVEHVLQSEAIPFRRVELGEVSLEAPLSEEQRVNMEKQLQGLGFELIDNRRQVMVDKIKKAVMSYLETLDGVEKKKLSAVIAAELHHEYTYLSDLFSTVEGLTIETYFIRLRIEKAKELLVYDELTLSEIAWKLGYSSVQHLSNQFKKVTRLTPTHFKQVGAGKRLTIDSL